MYQTNKTQSNEWKEKEIKQGWEENKAPSCVIHGFWQKDVDRYKIKTCNHTHFSQTKPLQANGTPSGQTLWNRTIVGQSTWYTLEAESNPKHTPFGRKSYLEGFQTSLHIHSQELCVDCNDESSKPLNNDESRKHHGRIIFRGDDITAIATVNEQ